MNQATISFTEHVSALDSQRREVDFHTGLRVLWSNPGLLDRQRLIRGVEIVL